MAGSNVENYLPYISLVLVHSVFAAWNIVGRIIFSSPDENSPSPVAFSLIREVLSSVILTGVAYFLDGPLKINYALLRKDLPELLLLGTTATFINQIGFIYGLAFTDPLTTAVFQPLTPIVTTILAAILFKSIPNRKEILGMISCVLGAIIVTIGNQSVNHPELKADEDIDHDHQKTVALFYFGLFCTISSITGFAYSLFVQKRLFSRYSTKWLTAISYSIGASEMSIAALIIDGPRKLIDIQFTRRVIAALSFVIIFATVMNYSLLTYANKQTDQKTVSVFVCVNPFVTAVLAGWFLNQPITPVHALGGVLIGFGLYLFQVGSTEQKNYKPLSNRSSDPDNQVLPSQAKLELSKVRYKASS